MSKRQKKNFLKDILNFAKSDLELFIRFTLLLFIFIALTLITFSFWLQDNANTNKIAYSIDNEPSVLGISNEFLTGPELPAPNIAEIESAESIKVEQDRIKTEEERKRKEQKEKADRLAVYLSSIGSPMAEHSLVIIQETEKCGADYKIIVAIAGNESGYGKVSYKLYNPFGYLNGVQYPGWEIALQDLTCKVAKFTNKYTDIYTLGKIYGAHNPEQWAKNINWHLSRIP